MLKYIIGWERMKEKKWWFFMVRTTKNACPQVIVLIGQVTIVQSRGAQYPTSPPSLPSQHTHAQSGSWWAPRTAKVDAGRWDHQITRILPGPSSGINATHFFTFPTPILTQSCGQQEKDASLGTTAEVLPLQWTEVTHSQAKIMLRTQRMRKDSIY